MIALSFIHLCQSYEKVKQLFYKSVNIDGLNAFENV